MATVDACDDGPWHHKDAAVRPRHDPAGAHDGASVLAPRRVGAVFRWCVGKKPQDPYLAACDMESRPGMSHWPEVFRQALPG